MLRVSNTNKHIILTIISLSLIIFGVGCFFAKDVKTYFLGLFLGTLFSILKIILLEKTLEKSINMNPEKAVNYTRLHYSLRYLLTGAVLIIAAKNPNLSLIGVILGILILRPALFIISFKIKK